MRNYLPSWQLVAVFTLIISGGVYSLYKPSETAPEINPSQGASLAKALPDANIDSDGDGAPDWEEVVWGTNPSLSDTDGDGVSDRIEISEKTVTKKIVDTTVPEKIDSPLTETDKFSRELFTRFIELRKQNALGTASSAEAIESLASSIGSFTPNERTYSRDQVLFTPEDTLTTRATYFSQLNDVFRPYQAIKIGDELAIFKDALEKKDVSAIQKLEEAAQAYKTIGEGVMKLAVPRSRADAHMALANAVSAMGESVSLMTKAQSDVLLAFASIEPFTQNAHKMAQAVQQIR